MTTDELKQSIATDLPKLISDITTSKAKSDVQTYLNQLDVTKHSILDKPNKIYKDENNNQKQVTVAKLPVPFQRQIVSRAATFLCGNPIELSTGPLDEKQDVLLKAIKKVWDDNKLHYKSKQLAKIVFAETEAAELWYIEPIDQEENYWEELITSNFKPRVKILANSLGDSLYPVFSDTGDMIAFGRAYTITTQAGDKVDHFDLYTNDYYYLSVKNGDSWTTETKPNIYKKIPVIYYSQPNPDWADVQYLIDQFESRISNQSDVNDYFGSPLLKVTGKIASLSQKGESGKVVELEAGADVGYVTWDQSPASVKMELETMERLIYQSTDTPNISFEQMKGLGTFSGIALKMLFMGAHMKASDKEETFGEGVQRRINFIKATLRKLDVKQLEKINMQVSPKFEYFIPKDFQELINTLVNAVSGNIMSSETAVTLNPYVENPEGEIEKIKEEQSGADALNKLLNTNP